MEEVVDFRNAKCISENERQTQGKDVDSVAICAQKKALSFFTTMELRFPQLPLLRLFLFSVEMLSVLETWARWISWPSLWRRDSVAFRSCASMVH